MEPAFHPFFLHEVSRSSQHIDIPSLFDYLTVYKENLKAAVSCNTSVTKLKSYSRSEQGHSVAINHHAPKTAIAQFPQERVSLTLVGGVRD